MAVENDYHLLVVNLGYLADEIAQIRHEVQRRLLEERRDELAPNALDWVNLLSQRLVFVESMTFHLRDGVTSVLRSRPGEPVFEDQPPEAQDAPP